jgi:valyl-tRNA synthetase
MAMGMDTRFSYSKVDTSRAFINKLWNSSKFVSMHARGEKILNIADVELTDSAKWIMYKLAKLIDNVSTNMDNFDVGVALTNIYNFVLDDFCDWFVELSKPDIFAGGKRKQNAVSVLSFVQSAILKLLHPYIPYVTEYIYQHSEHINSESKLLMTSQMVNKMDASAYADGYKKMEEVIELIKNLRALKADSGIAISEKPKVSAPVSAKEMESVINKLAGVELTYELAEGKVVVSSLGKFTLVEAKVDADELKKQINAEIDKLNFEISRSQKMLSNPGFVSKAPQALIDSEKQKLAVNTQKLADLKEKLETL